MSEGKQPIIIKKVIKKGHAGHHGGAWKVAYADFVTAMMALFLVLWLVAMLSMQAKKGVGEYFRSYSIFKGEGSGGGAGISALPGYPVRLDKEEGDSTLGNIFKTQLALRIEKTLRDRLGKLSEQVLVYTTKDGIRIELVDKSGSPMFELGKAELLPKGEMTLKTLASTIKKTRYEIIIEGHTDSYQYNMDGYSNWELAADRANTTRRWLVMSGVDPSRIRKVISFADTKPLNQSNPYDPANRRVSIVLKMTTDKKS